MLDLRAQVDHLRDQEEILMDAPKEGEIITTDTPGGGRSITIGAPVIRATGAYPSTPSEAVGQMVRHLKGVAVAAEELQKILEKEEQEQ
jgi:hypothetical protein